MSVRVFSGIVSKAVRRCSPAVQGCGSGAGQRLPVSMLQPHKLTVGRAAPWLLQALPLPCYQAALCQAARQAFTALATAAMPSFTYLRPGQWQASALKPIANRHTQGSARALDERRRRCGASMRQGRARAGAMCSSRASSTSSTPHIQQRRSTACSGQQQQCSGAPDLLEICFRQRPAQSTVRWLGTKLQQVS